LDSTIVGAVIGSAATIAGSLLVGRYLFELHRKEDQRKYRRTVFLRLLQAYDWAIHGRPRSRPVPVTELSSMEKPSPLHLERWYDARAAALAEAGKDEAITAVIHRAHSYVAEHIGQDCRAELQTLIPRA